MINKVTRVGLPNTMTVSAIDRDTTNGCWRLWIHTNDYVYGTFVALHNNGKVERITTREGDGMEDITCIKPKDMKALTAAQA